MCVSIGHHQCMISTLDEPKNRFKSSHTHTHNRRKKSKSQQRELKNYENGVKLKKKKQKNMIKKKHTLKQQVRLICMLILVLLIPIRLMYAPTTN